METTSKQMQFTFKAPGALVCHLNGFMYIIVEHKINELETCGYDIVAYKRDGDLPVRKEFMGSFEDALEVLDLFIFLCEEETA
jgi:hypothetical protein